MKIKYYLNKQDNNIYRLSIANNPTQTGILIFYSVDNLLIGKNLDPSKYISAASFEGFIPLTDIIDLR